jgi:hypothetical protein
MGRNVKFDHWRTSIRPYTLHNNHRTYSSWILFEELWPVHRDLHKVSYLRFARKAVQGGREGLFDVSGGSFRNFQCHAGEVDIGCKAVCAIAGVVEG